MTIQKTVTNHETPLDMRPSFRYKTPISLIEGRLPGGKPERRSEGGACARICNPLPGGFGHHVLRYYGRCVRCFHWTGTGKSG